LLGLALIVVLGTLLYSNSFNCPFHFDDSFNIVDNISIRNLSDVNAWWNYSNSRPIAFFSFALNYHFNQLNPWGWHLVNLAIHLVNALLVWWLALLIFSSPVLKDHPISQHKKMLALLTALLFVSHPLATQSITYIVQRMASLVALFYLLSIALYAKARLLENSNVPKYLLFAGSLISAGLALLTKENAFTLPLAIVLFEVCFFNTKSLFGNWILACNRQILFQPALKFSPDRPHTTANFALPEIKFARFRLKTNSRTSSKKISVNFKNYRFVLLPVAVLGVLCFALSKYSVSTFFKPLPPDSINGYQTITSLNYFFTQFSVIVKYIGLLLLPINQNLDHDIQISNNFFEARTMVNFGLLLSLFILALFLFKKYRIISFGIFWVFLTLSIESSIIPINDLIFEHRTYLPSFGFFILLSSGIFILFWDKYRILAIAVFSLIIGSNSILTYQRNKVWKNELSLWSDVVSKSPNKARGYNNRGTFLSIEEKNDQALKDFNKAIALEPLYADAFHNRGIHFKNDNKYDQALNDFSKAIDLKPNYVEAFNNRGTVYNIVEKYELALKDFQKAIELRPNNTKAYFNSGIVYQKLEQPEKAIASFSKAIEIDPMYIKAYENRGMAYIKENRNAEALSDLNKSIEIDPEQPNLYNNLGTLYYHEKKYTEALSNYSKAITLKQDFASAYFNRGMTENTLGQKSAACQDLKKAADLGYQSAKDLFNQICK
jgi:tetratricopeptide (TPR) repeat protein